MWQEESSVKLRKGREQLVVNEKMLTGSCSVSSLCAYTMQCFIVDSGLFGLQQGEIVAYLGYNSAK